MGKLGKLIKFIFSGHTLIAWILVLAIVPTILIAFFVYDIADKTLYKTVSNNLISSAEKKVESINTYISERKLTLIQLSAMPQLIENIDALNSDMQNDKLTQALINPLKKYLEHISSISGIDDIYIVNVNDKIIYTLQDKNLLGKTLSDSSQTLQALHKAAYGTKILRAPYLSQFHDSSNSLKTRIFLSNPVLREGRLVAILIIRLDTHAIESEVAQLLDIIQSEEIFLASLAEDKVSIMFHIKNGVHETTPKSSNPQILRLLKRAIRGESGQPTELMQNGNELLSISRYVPQLNMGLLMTYNKSEIFKRIYELKIDMLAFTIISLFFVSIIAFWVSRKLQEANQKSEQLLENIFPQFVIEELKEKMEFAARNVHHVSILFVDIVKFTPFVSTKPPEVVVHTLTELFSRFDNLMDKYEMEKIKTLGDGYMAASGLISVQEDHVNRAVDCALDMILAVKHFNLDNNVNFAIRAGVDSGTVTAGIIGQKKFNYDLWGNVVNRASRMESNGVENNVQITQDAYDLLQNKELYIITALKGTSVKGIGNIDTYLIEGRKES